MKHFYDSNIDIFNFFVLKAHLMPKNFRSKSYLRNEYNSYINSRPELTNKQKTGMKFNTNNVLNKYMKIVETIEILEQFIKTVKFLEYDI